jgi:hypothetical protein
MEDEDGVIDVAMEAQFSSDNGQRDRSVRDISEIGVEHTPRNELFGLK